MEEPDRNEQVALIVERDGNPESVGYIREYLNEVARWELSARAATGDTIGVDPPARLKGGAVARLSVRTARVEFGAQSYDVAERVQIAESFRCLGDNRKAVIELDSEPDVAAAVLLSRHVALGRKRR